MDKQFLTFKEAIELLRLSRPTIERMIIRGEIPSYKVGKRRLFDRDELIEWVKSHREGESVKKPKRGRK
jgi:excisionase family DNA binding protein